MQQRVHAPSPTTVAFKESRSPRPMGMYGRESKRAKIGLGCVVVAAAAGGKRED